MFNFSGLINFLRIDTVSAAANNSESNNRCDRRIGKEKVKKEAFRETHTKSDCPKPRKSCSHDGGRGGRYGRGSNVSGPQDRSSTKEAGDNATQRTVLSGCGISSPAGDQATSSYVPNARVEKVKGRSDSGFCGKGVGDRGSTGAGVAGSRADVDPEDDATLPAGAIYPGLLRHIHNAARYTLPECFEGASISVKQSTNNNWVLGHSMSFSSVSPGGYRLLLSYIDKNKPSTLPYFVMEASPSGPVSCEFRVGPTQNSRAAFVAQTANGEFKSFESIIDLYFNRTTASMIAVNREFIALHLLQGITKRLSVGAELMARRQFSDFNAGSGAIRWASEHVAVSGTFGNRGIDLCYARLVKPHLTIAAMIEVGFVVRRAVATLAYEWREHDWVYRASVDSDGLVGGTLHHRLGGRKSQLACSISALLNHPNDKFKLGFGITAAVI